MKREKAFYTIETKSDNKYEPKVMATNPLDHEDILIDFYRPGTRKNFDHEDVDNKSKPEHYKVVCISLYKEDISKLNSMVAELKRRGHSKANKSQLIRAALEQLDLSRIPNIR